MQVLIASVLHGIRRVVSFESAGWLLHFLHLFELFQLFCTFCTFLHVFVFISVLADCLSNERHCYFLNEAVRNTVVLNL